MRTATKPHQSLTAADLMSMPVVVIPQAMSLRSAAHLLSQARVSGAPVVDNEGRCVGVLSATDFIAWADKGEKATKQDPVYPGCFHSPWQMTNRDLLPSEEVSCFMTADPVMAPPETSLGNLARLMLDAHIHRIVVVDGNDRPIGIVSSTDILAAVAYADVDLSPKG